MWLAVAMEHTVYNLMTLRLRFGFQLFYKKQLKASNKQ